MKLRLLAIPFALLSASALAGLGSLIFQGVHFKAHWREVDFGLPPPRTQATSYGPWDTLVWRPGTDYVAADESLGFMPKPGPVARERSCDASIRKAIRDRDVDRLRGLYRRADRESDEPDPAVRERLDLLVEIGARRPRGMWAYLEGKPVSGEVGAALRPYVEFDEVVKGAARSPCASALRFVRLAERYPHSAKAPAALIMAARTLTRSGRHGYPDEELRIASAALRRLLARYPRSRFAWQARGGLGRIEFLEKRYDGAIRHYRIQMRERVNGEVLRSMVLCERARGNRPGRAEMLLRLYARRDLASHSSLQGAFEGFAARDAEEFRRRLLRDSALLDAYVEYRVDHTRITKDLLAFENAAGLRSRGYAQLASAALTLRDGARARRLARAALRSSDDRESHALATFVLASLERRAGNLRAAHRGYSAILRRWPKSYLVGGARENLALLEERFGNLPAALDHYTAQDYFYDVAYTIDARMTSAELAEYIRTRPGHPRRADMIYTLGMRYLREGKWDGAESAFARLPVAQRKRMTTVSPWDREQGGLQDPMATLKALRMRHRAVDGAKGKAAKAKALYALGGYYYHHRHLLLYSPPAWKGSRAIAFGFSWNPVVAQPADDRALQRHHEEHEALAHALRAFREIVRDYQDSPEAPKAAYWGACAAERLSVFAPYWRWRGRNADLMGEAVRLMRFAERVKDPKLAARVRKYGKVFRRYYEEDQVVFSKEGLPARRYGTGTSEAGIYHWVDED